MHEEDKAPLFSARAVVNKRSFIGLGPVEAMVRRDLANQIAHAIARSGRVQVQEGEYETTFRLEVIIMSPDELHREARRLADQMMGRGRPYDLWVEPGVKP